MNLPKISFKGFVSHKRRPTGFRDPNKDWLIIASAFSMIALVSAVLLAIFFVRVNNGTIFKKTVAAPQEQPTFNHDSITALGSFYQDREDVLNDLKTRKTDVVDPSL